MKFFVWDEGDYFITARKGGNMSSLKFDKSYKLVSGKKLAKHSSDHPILEIITYYFNGPDEETSRTLNSDEQKLYSTIKRYFK